MSVESRSATARGLALSGRPHPAVVRVITQDRGGHSYGSGALVAVLRNCGLVVTNWHVVRDAAGKIVVVFPDGFSSPATLLGADRVWDLAALAVWCPQVEPIRLATQPPRPGDVLTIAGYGPGWYRAATGRCTQYVAPGPNQPFEMVELSVAARQGDSGGPILNARGELAGVLFGAAGRTTTGSYCGRVRRFLDAVTGGFDRFAPDGTMLAQADSVRPEGRQVPDEPRAAALPEEALPEEAIPATPANHPPPAAIAGRRRSPAPTATSASP
ncbi:MAG TPA: serine protease, partial [Planctomycetaceae bacterium]|nr:serine protease [Planctomycetaceae bacterium]